MWSASTTSAARASFGSKRARARSGGRGFPVAHSPPTRSGFRFARSPTILAASAHPRHARADQGLVAHLRSAWRCTACGAIGTSHAHPSNCSSCGAGFSKLNAYRYLKPAGFSCDPWAKPHDKVEEVTYIPPKAPWVAAQGGEWAPFSAKGVGRHRGRGAINGSHCPGRSVGRKPPSPGSCSGTRSPRRVFTASRRRSLSIAQAA